MIAVTASIVFVGVAVTQDGQGGTMSLGFKTLPMVFAAMPGGNFFGGAFFLILFLAAITSSLSMLQPTKAFIEESVGCTRVGSTMIVTGWGLIGNVFVLYYSKNLIALDTIDFWVGTFFILVVAGIQIVAFGWIFGVDKGLKEAHEGSNMRIPAIFGFIMKYVSPTFLLVVVIGFCVDNAPSYVDTLFGNVTVAVKPDTKTEKAIKADFPLEGELSYQWTQIDADGIPKVTLANDDTRTASFDFVEPDEPTNFEVPFRLKVDDGSTEKSYPVGITVDVESPGGARTTWILLLATIAGIALLVTTGARRQKALGMDIDGQRGIEV